MLSRKAILVFLLFISHQFAAQSVELFGEAQPGGLLIGKAPDAAQVMLDNEIIKLSEDGYFILGFDRDAEGSYLLKIKYQNGKSQLKIIRLSKRNYQIQRINNMKSKYVSPPKEELDKIERESELIKNARREIGRGNKAYYASGFVKPISSNRQTGVFGSQRILNGIPKNFHNGLDFGAPTGSPVYAMTDGIVAMAGENFYYNGNFVLLDHGQGLNSFYLHLSKLDVSNGDFVSKGQKIGEVGSTGRSTGPHLHWGVQWYYEKIDPQIILDIASSFK